MKEKEEFSATPAAKAAPHQSPPRRAPSIDLCSLNSNATKPPMMRLRTFLKEGLQCTAGPHIPIFRRISFLRNPCSRHARRAPGTADFPAPPSPGSHTRASKFLSIRLPRVIKSMRSANATYCVHLSEPTRCMPGLMCNPQHTDTVHATALVKPLHSAVSRARVNHLAVASITLKSFGNPKYTPGCEGMARCAKSILNATLSTNTEAMEQRIEVNRSGNPQVHAGFRGDGQMCKIDTKCDSFDQN